MISNLVIRRATASDAERVQELRKLGWQDNYVNEETGVTRELLVTELAVLPAPIEDIEHYRVMV